MISLKTIRKKAGWSQMEMAKYLQLSKSHISMHESGKRSLARQAEDKLLMLDLELDGLYPKAINPEFQQNATAEIDRLRSLHQLDTFHKLTDHLAQCQKKIHSLRQQLITAKRHYSTAMDTMVMVARKQHAEIPPDEVQALLLQGMQAEASVKLLRFPLHIAELLKIKIAALEREEQATITFISNTTLTIARRRTYQRH